MEIIEGILLEPVGCLAEFPAEPFHEIAARFFDPRMLDKRPSRSASRSYWHLLNLIEASGKDLGASDKAAVEAIEIEAAERASLYEDVLPALLELKSMGIRLIVASSLGEAALTRFVDRALPREAFAGIWSRDRATGVKSRPLASALQDSSLRPVRTIFLADTAEGIASAKKAGIQPILMMNDPDEAKRLAGRDPAGGIVSFHELPDFARLLAVQNARLGPAG